MTCPRIELDLVRIGHNARILVALAAARGVGITAVTKSVLGLPVVARALLDAGVSTLGDSRIDNVELLRAAGIDAPILLVRSPMPSQVARVVDSATASCNSEIEVMAMLSAAAMARGVVHGVVVMVELGDLREGVLPGALHDTIASVLRLPGIDLRGIGTNLACRSGVVPDQANMDELSALALGVESTFGLSLAVVSGGNSANLEWLLGGGRPGRVDDLRLGESIMLGCEPLHRRPIDGLYTDAVAVVAEVIESKRKPVVARGRIAQAAYATDSRTRGAAPDDGRRSVGPSASRPSTDDAVPSVETRWQSILAIGRQDVDPAGLTPPSGIEILGASSDHLVIASTERLAIGSEVAMTPGYGALVGAMTSPFVARRIVDRSAAGAPEPVVQRSSCNTRR